MIPITSKIIVFSTLISLGVIAYPQSERTLSIAITINKNEARLHSYTLKNHSFDMDLKRFTESHYQAGRAIPLNIKMVSLQGPDITREVFIGALCLDHEPSTPPHINGDTILLHEDSFIVEMPEQNGYDTISIELPLYDNGVVVNKSLGSFKLDRAHFDESAQEFSYDDLIFADKSDQEASVVIKANNVLWPENFGEAAKYKVFGLESEGATRINVVIVPDGYKHAEKALMEQHAQALVQAFRLRTPYKEHDHLINYVLVYAYSVSSGTDQCDCGTVLNTAMGCGFQNEVHSCGNSENRCLYYTNPCDSSAINNIVAAEQRAPFSDTTIVMVNTSRYGGCGGARAVYSAANAQAQEIAIHELGHSLGDLADEYAGSSSCGNNASGINTSTNPNQGSWPEWISTIGAPKEGGQYYDRCIYRPEQNCQMRQLNNAFCHVCNQQFSRVFYGHPRVAPTAPMKSFSPTQKYLSLKRGAYTSFRYDTRLNQTAQNSSSFYIKAPQDPGFTKLPIEGLLWVRFLNQGIYQIKAEVIADINLVKPQKTDSNKDTVTWQIFVGPAVEHNRSPYVVNDNNPYEILNN